MAQVRWVEKTLDTSVELDWELLVYRDYGIFKFLVQMRKTWFRKRIDCTFCISGILSLLELSMFFLVFVTLFVSYLTNVPS